MAGNAAQALYTAAGRILSFASTFPSQGATIRSTTMAKA